MKSKYLAKTVLASMLGAACTTSSLQALATNTPSKTNQNKAETTKNSCAGMNLKNIPKERCFGIVKKAKNECGTSKHACASQATHDNDDCEWIYVLKGNCKRITGGRIKEPNKCEQTAINEDKN